MIFALWTLALRAQSLLKVHQEMTLPTEHFLPSVVTALFSAYTGTLHRLAIHYASTGLGISLQRNPQTLADRLVDSLSQVPSLFAIF
jgi:hypothetical protein